MSIQPTTNAKTTLRARTTGHASCDLSPAKYSKRFTATARLGLRGCHANKVTPISAYTRCLSNRLIYPSHSSLFYYKRIVEGKIVSMDLLTLSPPGFFVLQKPKGAGHIVLPPPLAKTLLPFSESIQEKFF